MFLDFWDWVSEIVIKGFLVSGFDDDFEDIHVDEQDWRRVKGMMIRMKMIKKFGFLVILKLYLLFFNNLIWLFFIYVKISN